MLLCACVSHVPNPPQSSLSLCFCDSKHKSLCDDKQQVLSCVSRKKDVRRLVVKEGWLGEDNEAVATDSRRLLPTIARSPEQYKG